jgi:hypothetical protein
MNQDVRKKPTENQALEEAFISGHTPMMHWSSLR